MTNQTAPIKPANLDPTRLHSPAEYAAWKSDTAAYFQALRNIERQKEIKAEAIKAEANRPLTADEYYQEAVKRKAIDDAKHAEREALTKANALAEIDRLMASPEIAEVMHRNEYSFLLEVIQWSNRGYVMADNGFMSFMPGMYHVLLQAPPPAPTTTKKAAAK